MELLYADDLVLMAESEESLHEKTVQWKSRLKAKGLKWNTGKTKAMFNCSRKDRWKRVLKTDRFCGTMGHNFALYLWPAITTECQQP